MSVARLASVNGGAWVRLPRLDADDSEPANFSLAHVSVESRRGGVEGAAGPGQKVGHLHEEAPRPGEPRTAFAVARIPALLVALGHLDVAGPVCGTRGRHR